MHQQLNYIRVAKGSAQCQYQYKIQLHSGREKKNGSTSITKVSGLPLDLPSSSKPFHQPSCKHFDHGAVCAPARLVSDGMHPLVAQVVGTSLPISSKDSRAIFVSLGLLPVE
ncbi:hypothetical protein C1H46_035026 [Malus baccata]|uniref:Uncharacterized protein n=1 Tax=Malus baccata TaxID=106549 RepID=A0A540KZA3_MALBA|nr:hypothetical protein C1H46_035026 [Malus baccata]